MKIRNLLSLPVGACTTCGNATSAKWFPGLVEKRKTPEQAQFRAHIRIMVAIEPRQMIGLRDASTFFRPARHASVGGHRLAAACRCVC